MADTEDKGAAAPAPSTSSSSNGKPIREGTLTKSPPIKAVNEKTFSRWKRRWFVLTDAELVYHVSQTSKHEIKGAIDLSTCVRIKTTVPAQQHSFVFSIKYTTVDGVEREMFLSASSQEERDAWCEAVLETASKVVSTEIVVLPKKRSSVTSASSPVPAEDETGADAESTEDVIHQGILRKSPAKVGAVDQRSTWRARWFVLSGSKLQYFTDVDEDVLKGVIDLADVLRLQPKVLSVRYEFVFALHCQKEGEKIRSYFLASNEESERDQWVEKLKPEIEAATKKATVIDTRTEATSPEDEGSDTVADLIDSAEIWPVVSRKLGHDLLSKDGAGIKEMMLEDDQVLAATPAELEDLMVELLGAEAVQDGKIALGSEEQPVHVEELFRKMDTTRGGSVLVYGFLSIVSPSTAREVEQSKRQVQRHLRASFSQQVRKPGSESAGVSVDEAIMEAEEAADDELPEANEYSDSEDDSGDEWYGGLFDEVEEDEESADADGADVAIDVGDDDETSKLDDDDEDEDENEADDEDDEDDDDEDMDVEDLIDEADSYDLLTAYDSELVTYTSIPPRVYPTVKLSKESYGKEPILCRDGDLWTYLAALVKERHAYLKMGPNKRPKPAGRNRRQRIEKMLANVVEAFGKLGDQLNCVEKSSGFTLLHICCKKPKVTKDLVAMLLDLGADCNVPDKRGRTAMHLAAGAGHNKCVRRLLAAGGNPNLVSDKGLMPLLQTFKLKRRQRFQRGKIKVAEALVRSGRCNLDVGGDPNAKKPAAPPLIRLLQKGSSSSRAARIVEPFIHLLLSHGANPNVRRPGKSNTSAAWMALSQLKNGRISRAADCILRENKVEGAVALEPDTFNERDPHPKSTLTPFFLCCLYRQDNALEYLFHLDAEGREESYGIPKLKGCRKLPPMCNAFEAAAYSGCASTIKLFLKNDADGTRQKALLSPPVGWDEKWKGIENIPLIVIGITRASSDEAVIFASLILEYKMDVNAPHIDGMSIPLILTAIGHTRATMLLLEDDSVKVDLSVVDKFNRNIAFYAAYASVADRSAILAAVLERGADPLIVDTAGVTPLLAAARNGDEQSVMLLMNKAFTPLDRRVENPDWVPPKKQKSEKKEKRSLVERAKKMQRDSALAQAAGDHDGKAQSTTKMIPRIARNVVIGVAESDERGWAFLPRPAYTPGKYKGVSGDELNRKDAFGYSALWYAVLWCNADMVRMLISDPAVDVNVQNKDGMGGNNMTPLMLSACVRARGKLDIFFTLLKHPKIDLKLTNVRGHTVYDIAVLEEIEFMLRPMTDALKKLKCEVSKDLGVVIEFNKANGVRWKDPKKKGTAEGMAAGITAGAMASATAGLPAGMGAALGLPGGKEANPAWKGLLTAEPFYADTLWLRKQVAYDFTTSQELRKEWIRQKKDQAKYGSLKATMHSATILHMIKIGGSMAAALKHAAHFAMNSWLVYKACGLRNYDVEYHTARQLFPDLKLEEVKEPVQYIHRVHIPEDFGELRYHAGRFMRHSTTREEKVKLQAFTEKGVVHEERWVVKKRPKKIESWA